MGEPVRIKICGITDAVAAAACARAGVWAVGFVFAAGSPRRVSAADAAALAAGLPADTARVGVFVDAAPGELAATVAAAGLTHVQLHGTIDLPAVRDAVGVPVITGHGVADADAVADAARSGADLILLDAAVAGRHGGTGRAFDWGLLAATPPGRPFILAGGLDPDNVGAAIAATRPWAVDVSSGVESAPGRKDPGRIAAFAAAVREATTLEPMR